MERRTPLGQVLVDEGRRQNWLAQRVGKDPAEISRIVNGRLIPDEATKQAIADALGRTTNELFPSAQAAA